MLAYLSSLGDASVPGLEARHSMRPPTVVIRLLVLSCLFPLDEPREPLPPPRSPRVPRPSPVVGQRHLVVEDGGVVGGDADLDDLEAVAAPKDSVPDLGRLMGPDSIGLKILGRFS